MKTTIKIQPGAFDDLPVVELARFLNSHGLELVYRTDGLYIRKAAKAVQEAGSMK